MCAQFRLKVSFADLLKKFSIQTPPPADHIDELFVPYTAAPVITQAPSSKARELKAMNFSLVPAWSKEPKVKFATHNARLQSVDEKSGKVVPIYEKATWRDAFKLRHCLVPMTAFIEPIYSGEQAGNMLQFLPQDRSLLVAAGIWEEWTNKKNGEVMDSFAILTHDPYPFVQAQGHDRCPVFLDEGAQAEWLKVREAPREMLDFLLTHKVPINFMTAVERALRPGWEKRRKPAGINKI